MPPGATLQYEVEVVRVNLADVHGDGAAPPSAPPPASPALPLPLLLWPRSHPPSLVPSGHAASLTPY